MVEFKCFPPSASNQKEVPISTICFDAKLDTHVGTTCTY